MIKKKYGVLCAMYELRLNWRVVFAPAVIPFEVVEDILTSIGEV
jgi:hypothetical protein